MSVLDRHQRPLGNLRISVTDRCNLRCQYCMPEESYTWLPKADLLSFEEISQLVDAFTELGVRRIRLTGGEPLLRRGLPALVEQLAAKPAIEDLAMTTNAVLLPDQATPLAEAGLQRVTVSLDTLDPERFQRLTRRTSHAAILEGIDAAAATFPRGVKLNTVVMRGVNDDELGDLLELGRRRGVEVRFIEYMDVGGATRWSWDRVVPRAEILERIAARYGSVEALAEGGSAPADRFRLPDGLVFGVISSTTVPFCGTCDRCRLTADGQLFLCLYATHGHDLRAPLRDGATHDALRERLRGIWGDRGDRGAEDRLRVTRRRPLALAGELREDPHREMHTRGG